MDLRYRLLSKDPIHGSKDGDHSSKLRQKWTRDGTNAYVNIFNKGVYWIH